jgi:putative ABC transport system ATP-binding protein
MRIKAVNLSKSIGEKKLFHNITFAVDAGQIAAITGISGAGKSTLLRMMGLLTNWDNGYLAYDSAIFNRPNENGARLIRKDVVSFVFQNFGLLEDRSVYANLKLALLADAAFVDKGTASRQMERALAAAHLDVDLHRSVQFLSGGEKQRLAIARALLHPGNVILADEPTGALDAENKKGIIDLFKTLATEGKTVVVASHDQLVIDSADIRVHIP